jgi:deazaflavin-dependent oxidoreductase (nitroreductase family)
VPLPDRLARVNRRFLNPVMRTIAAHVPPLAIVDHTGRRSGRTYRTPVMAFHDGDRWVFAMTYGTERDWVRNVQAAGELDLEVRGRHLHLVEPTMHHGTDVHLPRLVTYVLGRLHVEEFLELHVA